MWRSSGIADGPVRRPSISSAGITSSRFSGVTSFSPFFVSSFTTPLTTRPSARVTIADSYPLAIWADGKTIDSRR